MTILDVNKNKKLFLSPNQVLRSGNNKLNISSFRIKKKHPQIYYLIALDILILTFSLRQMRIYSFIFLVFITNLPLKADLVEYVFLQWDCSEKLLLEGELVTANTRFEKEFEFSFDNPVSVSITNEIYIPLSECENNHMQTQPIYNSTILSVLQGVERKQRKMKVSIFPFKYVDGVWHKLLYASLKIEKKPLVMKKRSVSNSVLNQGDWYKLGVNIDGVHEITYGDLQALGIDVENIDPDKIQLYGKPAGMLPLLNNEERIEDLQELAIKVEGSSDAQFDNNDKVVFYGQSPNQWEYDSIGGLFKHQLHYFSDFTYYFLRVNFEQGLRVQDAALVTQDEDVVVTSFDDYAFRESEEVSLIKSGRKWYGDAFGFTNKRYFNFSFPNCDGPIYLKSVFATAVPAPYSSVYSIDFNGELLSINASGTSGSYTFASITTAQNQFLAASDIDISIQFSSNYAGAEGWIDYLALNTRRKLIFTDSQLLFRDTECVAENVIAEYQLSNANNGLEIWNVQDPLKPMNIPFSITDNVIKFKDSCSSLKEYIVFNDEYKSVQIFGAVENQNLHALQAVDMLIVSAPEFLAEANRLAQFHRINDNLTVEVVQPQQIYNEFSAGSQDVSAIRDFAKFLYENDSNPLQYLLLFGDASYDPKNRIPNNTNFIPSYQSSNSHSETNSYVSDDFFALLDEEESISENSSSIPFLDIGVGRFPVQTIEEARIVVDKVFKYHEELAMGAWRLNLCFIGDDNDVSETIHTAQAEELADELTTSYPLYNIDKIYLDAYQQESTPGGQRCELVNQAINERIEKGVFLVNYTGHGGELGWAHERILRLDDINTWSNKNKMPLFMTATCEFSRYDDPARVSAGEEVFLKEDAGAIALFSTSRVVFTGGNMDLNESFLAQLFQKNSDGSRPRVGDLFRKTKNTVVNISSTNHRNFTLLGDPALRLAYPQYKVELTNIQDSVMALGKVMMSGRVVDENGILLSGFNGFVYPSVFDKSIIYQTLGQDASPVLDFDLQNALLFKGKSTVTNGEFTFSFVVPKDINYSYGKGKVSLYAQGELNGVLVDAAGYNEDFVVGGTASDYQLDSDGPEVNIFMNDTLFQLGGVTNESPDLLALVFDENGVNTVGNGIGHDLVAILDENTTSPIILNDFYESYVDDYQIGEIKYPFNNLEEGVHTLRVKVWDVFNNSSEAYTEFLVSHSRELKIENLVNHPNPMMDLTGFYFEHNQSDFPLKVTLEVSDLQGKIVDVQQDNLVPNGFRYGPIYWDGKNKYGTILSSGVYIYRIIAISENGDKMEKSGKLVISR